MKKIHIVPNWVEDHYCFNLLKSEQCIFIGRLEPQKGIIELLKAWPIHERLIIVGDGSLKDDVNEVISNRDLNVEIIPKLEHSELMKLLGISKCLVCWSEFEGNPKVVLESLFMGVPVVSKDAPGVREIIELGNFGKLVKNSDGLEPALSSIEQTKVDYCEVKLLLRQSTFEFTLSENKRFLES
jgi:glycosyltransferase involved in cell wall biosynthesis